MAKVDSARKWSDKKLKKMEAEISDIYGSATKEISEKWVAYMERTNQKISKYQQAYDEAVKSKDADSISKAWDELVKAKTSQTLGNEYYQNMVNDTTTKMAEVNQIALAYANNQMPSVYAFNYNFADSDMQKLITNTGIDFSLADEATVKRRILDGDIKLPKKKVDIPKDKRWNTKQLNSSVLQGIIQGESMKDIAKRILPIVNNNEKAAIRNARTMMTGAECQGRVDRYKNLEEQGVVTKKVWIATGDNRTRDWHLEMDGQERDVDEDFEDGLGNLIQYPGDPSAEPETVYNCRCAIKSHIIGFRRADGSISYIDESESDAESFHKAEIEAERERRNEAELPKPADLLGKSAEGYSEEQQKELGKLLENSPENVQRLYEKYSQDLQAPVDLGGASDPHNLDNRAFFTSTDEKVYMNLSNVAEGDNYNFAYETHYHEYAHNMDYLAGKEFYGEGKYFSTEYRNDEDKSFDDVITEGWDKIFKEPLGSPFWYEFEGNTDIEAGGMGASRYAMSYLNSWRRENDISRDDERFSSLKDILRNTDDIGIIRNIMEDNKDIFESRWSGGEDSAYKAAVARNIKDFVEEIKGKYDVKEYASLSDMLERYSVRYGAGAYPMGFGHGAGYAEREGSLAKESFAEFQQGATANEGSLNVLKTYQPEAYKMYNEMLEVITK